MVFPRQKNIQKDQILFAGGFFRTLVLEAENEIYRTLGKICLGMQVEIDEKIFFSYRPELQNTILSRCLPLNREKFKHLVRSFHQWRVSSYSGKKVKKPFGVFTDDDYFLYKAHLDLMELNLPRAIKYLNKHYAFHLPGKNKVDDFFEPFEHKKRSNICGPRISIILCAKNEEKYLRRALISILNQTFNNIELIFVDDGSTDSTSKIYHEYAHRFPSSKYIQTMGIGVWKSKNLALRQTSGEFITFHDGDDWSHPFKLELQCKPLLKSAKKIATVSQNIRISEDQNELCTKNARFLQRLNPSSFMFKENVISKIGYFFDDLLAGDIEYIKRLQLILGVNALKQINLPLMIGTSRPQGLSNMHHGIHGKRIRDWENWNLLHKYCANTLKQNPPEGCAIDEYIHTNNLRHSDTQEVVMT